MRRCFAGALMMLFCLLTACGQGKNEGDDLAMQIRTEFIAMTACSGQVDIVADYGDRVYDFVLDFSYAKDGNTVLTVVEPSMLAGISVTIEAGETSLSYDGASLETGSLSADGLSPISSFPTIMSDVIGGYIAESAIETLDDQEALHLCIRDPEAQAGSGSATDVWFNTTTHAPMRAEISEDGFTVIQCEFLTFTME